MDVLFFVDIDGDTNICHVLKLEDNMATIKLSCPGMLEDFRMKKVPIKNLLHATNRETGLTVREMVNVLRMI